MSRLLSPALKQQFDAPENYVVLFAYFDFGPNATDAVFLHTDVGDVSLDLDLPSPHNGSQTYLGVGTLGTIYDIRESASDREQTYSLVLSGLNPDIVGEARTLDHQGRLCKVWIGAFNPDSGETVGTTEQLSGTMDKLDVVFNEGVANLSVLLVDERSLLRKGKGVLFSHTQQQDRNRNDGFFKGAARAREKQVVWGPSSARNFATGMGSGAQRDIDQPNQR